MDQPKSQNTHYLPEWLLRKFRQPVLLELDIWTGKTEQRDPRKAGSAQDLWSEDIEDGLSIFDNQAAQIYRNKIQGQQRIVLSDSERMDFALWLAQFVIRVPVVREDARGFLDEYKQNPGNVAQLIHENRAEILRRIRERNPQLYAETVRECGVAITEEFLLSSVVQRYTRPGSFRWPTGEELHHHYMRNNSAERFARRLCEYEWVWLHSPYGFVIGDNPLVRWHVKSRKWNCGIDRNGVEITMPLGLNLCLRLEQHHWQEAGHLRECDKKQTRLFNCRQRLAAIKYVYGNSVDLLDFIANRITGWHPSSGGGA